MGVISIHHTVVYVSPFHGQERVDVVELHKWSKSALKYISCLKQGFKSQKHTEQTTPAHDDILSWQQNLGSSTRR